MMAFVHVRFAAHAASNHDILLRQIDGIPEVVEAYSLTGSWDYILKVVVQSLARFEEIINTTFSVPGCNLQVQSSFVLRQLKQSNRLPLPRADAAGP
jgi:DNA-binding Lrp family transcriptional regulator